MTDPLTGYSPLTITFTDTSTPDPISWLWDFGNGQTSTLRSPPPITYSTGTYTVSLSVTNATESGNITNLNYIIVNPLPIYPAINADFNGEITLSDLYVVAPGYRQYTGEFGLPSGMNYVYLGDLPVLVATTITDVVSFPFENSVMAITGDSGLFLSGRNSYNLLVPEALDSDIIYASYNDTRMGRSWQSFTGHGGNDGANRSTPAMVLKADGKIYEWGGGEAGYYGDINWLYDHTQPIVMPFDRSFKFTTPGSYGVVAYNGLETWFIGDTAWLADLGTKRNVVGPGTQSGYVAFTWEKIQGLPFEPIEVAFGGRDLFLLLDHDHNLWAYANTVSTAPVMILNDVQHLIPTKPGNKQFGFINSAGEMWYLNTNRRYYAGDIVAITPSTPLANNFHRLTGGPWKWADTSDWSIGMVALDIYDQAWVFDWNAPVDFSQDTTAPSFKFNTGGKPVKKVVMQVNSAFLLVQR